MSWKFEKSGVDPDDLGIQPVGGISPLTGVMVRPAYDLGVDISVVSEPTDPVARVRTESEFESDRRYLLVCPGCGDAVTVLTGHFELTGVFCPLCSMEVECHPVSTESEEREIEDDFAALFDDEDEEDASIFG